MAQYCRIVTIVSSVQERYTNSILHTHNPNSLVSRAYASLNRSMFFGYFVCIKQVFKFPCEKVHNRLKYLYLNPNRQKIMSIYRPLDPVTG